MRKTIADVDLDPYVVGLDPENREGGGAGEHWRQARTARRARGAANVPIAERFRHGLRATGEQGAPTVAG